MARKSVLTDVTPMSYQGVDFDAQVIEWTDTRKPRIAMHEYLKRDGGEAEYMGRSPHRIRLVLVYVGDNWRKEMLVLQRKIDETPIGVLAHPFLGKMTVACDGGIDGAKVNVQGELDTVTVPVSFVESELDRTTDLVTPGPSTQFAAVTGYNAATSTATRAYILATTPVASLTGAAAAYASAAMTAVTPGSIPDPTVNLQLANVVAYAKTARDAVRSDPLATDDVASFGAISSIELLMDACAQLDDAIKTVKPVLSQYTVPAQCSLLSIAQNYYGRDAVSRLDEIRANNVGKIPNPAAIAAGTVLFIAPSTLKPPAG